MNLEKQIKKANYFKELHHDGMFLLPNAWNGGSAKIFEKEGFKAVGTTSAGIAYSMGYEDGEKIDFKDVYRITKEILDVIDIPLTVDLERGYGDNNKQIADNVKKIIELGAVGINIEDGQPENNKVDEIDEFCDKIKILSNLKKTMGIPFLINARTDIFLLGEGSIGEKVEKAIKRAKLIEDAGADCIFLPGSIDVEGIKKLRNSINLPINLYLHPAYSDLRELESIGINRLSSGSGIVRSSLNNIINISKDFIDKNVVTMLNHDFTYGKANEFFGK
jgi:2-methylisocitrate lyase-like PEP mutase family enzyme